MAQTPTTTEGMLAAIMPLDSDGVGEGECARLPPRDEAVLLRSLPCRREEEGDGDGKTISVTVKIYMLYSSSEV